MKVVEEISIEADSWFLPGLRFLGDVTELTSYSL